MSGSTAETGLRLREQDLAGKTAVVTGASRGIGRAIALNFASRGCNILGTCSSADSLHHIDTLSHSIADIYHATGSNTSKPIIRGLDANLLDSTTPSKMADALQRHFDGHLDIFVNNAAVTSAMKIGEITDDHIGEYLKGNVEIPVKMVEEFVRRKLFRPKSRIICISSVRARLAWSDQ